MEYNYTWLWLMNSSHPHLHLLLVARLISQHGCPRSATVRSDYLKRALCAGCLGNRNPWECSMNTSAQARYCFVPLNISWTVECILCQSSRKMLLNTAHSIQAVQHLPSWRLVTDQSISEKQSEHSKRMYLDPEFSGALRVTRHFLAGFVVKNGLSLLSEVT